jgi:acetyl-CoA carboxylase biotin carboxyl carrier protein
MSLSHEDVLRILALLDASDFDELRLETSDYKLHVRRSGALPQEPAPADGATALPAGAAQSQAAPPQAPPATTAQSAPNPAQLTDVKTPLLGTFYRSPQPGAPPFVEVGSAVDTDTVIGIVEVMKLMSSISAGAKGVVAEVLAKDGALVEYNEVLMRIAPPGA